MSTLADAWSWLTTAANWSGESGVRHRLGEHLLLTVVCLALSCLIALPVALVLGHLGKGGTLAVNLANAGRAVPTFAVLVLLLLSPLGPLGPLGPYGQWPTIIADLAHLDEQVDSWRRLPEDVARNHLTEKGLLPP